MSRIVFWISVASLVALLGIELATDYDEPARQLALAFTNISVIAIVFLIRRSFTEQERVLLALIGVAAALGVWFDALGNFVHFYARFFWWDRVAHAFGSAAAAVMSAGLFLHFELKKLIRLPYRFHVLVAVSVGMLFAVLYEISELVGDELFNLHRISDLYDTADDLRFNLLATIPAALIVVLVAKRSKLLDK